ncbi:MAG: transporter substrate-binding domain-containing protein [Clostridia bacterium]|nr:transporter substrate-binding domain-containing protein [Clostridia bacterium]
MGFHHRRLIFAKKKKEKKKMKKIIALIAVLALVLSLAACGKGVDATKDLDNIKSAGVLKVGMECAYAPFNWTQTDNSNGAVEIANAKGFANGYDVQMAKSIAEALGVKLEVYSYEWDALIPAVESGKLDCIIAGMSPTDERKETIDFSSNYYVSNLVIIVKKDSDYASAASLKDFAGAKINAQDGTFHAKAAKQIKDVKTEAMKDFTMLYTAVTAGTIDGYIAEEPTAFQVCGSNEDLTYVPLVNNDTGFKCSEGDTAIAVGMRKGSSLNKEISDAIDKISVDARADLMKNMVAIAPAEE